MIEFEVDAVVDPVCETAAVPSGRRSSWEGHPARRGEPGLNQEADELRPEAPPSGGGVATFMRGPASSIDRASMDRTVA